jgi:hypothetical protein
MRAPKRAQAWSLALALIIGGLAGRIVDAQSGPATARTAQTAPPAAAQAQGRPPAAPAGGGPPAECSAGSPLFPGAQFLASYDAGRSQRFCLFGTTSSFSEVIAYYKVLLKQKGELVFDEPAVYAFDIGRYREDTMAFPPGVTVKDYSGAGQKGYLNPKPGGQPARFPTVIQIVPPPPQSDGVPKG